MGWKHSASTMTLLWKRITHSPARLTLRFVGVNCMVESNECTGSAIAKTHTHTRVHVHGADTRGKIYDRFETRTDARRWNRILQFACIICNFSRRDIEIQRSKQPIYLNVYETPYYQMPWNSERKEGMYRHGCCCTSGDIRDTRRNLERDSSGSCKPVVPVAYASDSIARSMPLSGNNGYECKA